MGFLSKKQTTIIKLIILLLAVFIFYYFILINESNKKDNQYNSTDYTHYSGVIVKKYMDIPEHNTPTLVFKNHKETGMNDEFYSQIDVGDSIVKKEGWFYIKVYKKNRCIILDYNWFYQKFFDMPDSLRRYVPKNCKEESSL